MGTSTFGLFAGDEDSSGKVKNLRAFELLHSLKNMCQKRRPGVSETVKVNFMISCFPSYYMFLCIRRFYILYIEN